MDWDRTAIEAAADYLRELIDAGAADERTRSVYNGLVDVLDPARYATRIQRVLAADAALALVRAGLDRRKPLPRRRSVERRLVNIGSLNGERRAEGARRIVLDRRGC
jgi:hypothetical protein